MNKFILTVFVIGAVIDEDKDLSTSRIEDETMSSKSEKSSVLVNTLAMDNDEYLVDETVRSGYC